MLKLCMQAADFMGCMQQRSVVIEWLQGLLKEVVQSSRPGWKAAASLTLNSFSGVGKML
jgi:hypothetical protein